MAKRYFGSDTGLKTLDEGRQVVFGLVPEYVFGPVDSRRYGRSLGINPFPVGEKICSFNCPYCECGWTSRLWVGVHTEVMWPSVADITGEIEKRLKAARDGGEVLEALTFAGNGEPTLHPGFPALAAETVRLRDAWAPQAKIIVLTNGTELNRPEIREALLLSDEPCFKLDTANPEVFERINKPHPAANLSDLVRWISDFPSPIIQAMFVQGPADNTSPGDVASWLSTLQQIHPRRVDVYSLDRTPPDKRFLPAPRERLEEIASQAAAVLGIPVNVY
jgi:wyosine [tRNA(Phe)-imidazoG37] synthetase (radical SAM superfamily)